MEKNRVLLLVPSLHGGGAERMAVHILNHCNREEFEVRLGLLRQAGEYLDEVDRSQIDSSSFAQRWLDYDKSNAAAYRPLQLLPGLVLAPFHTLQMMRRFRPHVVMSFRKGMSISTTAAVAAYGRHQVRWIAREGNNTMAVIEDELKQPLGRSFIKTVTRTSYRSADCLLTICDEMAHALARDLGTPLQRMRTIHNAVDLAYVRLRGKEGVPGIPDEPFLVAVGRLDRQKGFDVLLRAFARSKAFHEHLLVILGDGSQRSELEELSRSLGIHERVRLMGFTSNPWAYMARAKAFLLSSRWEGFANVVVEAMACGTPVMATNCDFGPKEILRHEESGLIVPVDDVAAMSEAMDRISFDDLLRERLIRSANRRVQDFDVHHIVRRYEALFRELASTLPQPPKR